MTRYNLIPSQDESLRKGQVAHSLDTDRHGISTDGNCRFHSLARIFAGLFNPPPVVTNQELRSQAVGYLRFEAELINEGIVDQRYLQTMGLDGTWGGALEVMALAYIWGVRINVVGPPNVGPSLDGGPVFGGSPSYLVSFNESAHIQANLYYNGSDHYSTGPLG